VISQLNLQQFPSEVTKRLMVEGLKSGCCLPLVTPGRVSGVLNVASLREDAFIQADVELLSQVANQIGIAIENALSLHQIVELHNKLADEKLYLEEEIRTEYNFEECVGISPALKRILQQAETVAPTDSTVLLQGETGTGKELVARAIHNLSPRRERTLVKVNCAAMPAGLLESELFGHEKGAFTGAIAQRAGRFELAHQGTLLLDEVGEIPLELQPKLLRVLQEREFERLGSTRTLHVDVRVVAATNADLATMVADKQFRSDLYYRLNVFPIVVPPLRERREDISLLVRHFVEKYARRMNKQITTIPAKAMTVLAQYPWPGNVRELENFIERAVILSRGPDLEVPLSELKQRTRAAAASTAADLTTLREAEREHILTALHEANWVIGGPAGAAARLGLKRTTLQSKMQRLGINRPQ
jgi:formate hydrogenlyase transcriptional activator